MVLNRYKVVLRYTSCTVGTLCSAFPINHRRIRKRFKHWLSVRTCVCMCVIVNRVDEDSFSHLEVEEDETARGCLDG